MRWAAPLACLMTLASCTTVVSLKPAVTDEAAKNAKGSKG